MFVHLLAAGAWDPTLGVNAISLVEGTLTSDTAFSIAVASSRAPLCGAKPDGTAGGARSRSSKVRFRTVISSGLR
jgi:hypothetical protein